MTLGCDFFKSCKGSLHGSSGEVAYDKFVLNLIEFAKESSVEAESDNFYNVDLFGFVAEEKNNEEGIDGSGVYNQIDPNESRLSQFFFLFLENSQFFCLLSFLPKSFLLFFSLESASFLLFLSLLLSSSFLFQSESFLFCLFCQIAQLSAHLAGVDFRFVDVGAGGARPLSS